MSNFGARAKFLTARTHNVKRDRHKYDVPRALYHDTIFKIQLKKKHQSLLTWRDFISAVLKSYFLLLNSPRIYEYRYFYKEIEELLNRIFL